MSDIKIGWVYLFRYKSTLGDVKARVTDIKGHRVHLTFLEPVEDPNRLNDFWNDPDDFLDYWTPVYEVEGFEV